MREISGNFRSRFSDFAAAAVLVITLLFMLFLTLSAFLETVYISTDSESGEYVRINQDNIFLNIIALLLIMASLYLFYRHRDELTLKRMEIVLVLWTLLFGTVFIFSTKLCAPWYSDSFIVVDAARRAAVGDFSTFDTYFVRFPFQFGYVLYAELFFRTVYGLFPGLPEGYYCLALQELNLIWLVLSYHALLKVCGNLFGSVRVQKMTALLLLFCFPAVISCTFLYGSIPAFAFGTLALWMFSTFLRNDRLKYGLLCGLFLGVAVILKLNMLIFAVAVAIVWLIELMRKFSFKSLSCLIIAAVLVLTLGALPQQIYEQRTGKEFGDGIPKICWMAMGFSDGHAGPGWYKEDNTVTAFAQHNYDGEATAEYAENVLAKRLAYFRANPRDCLRFFSTKLISQWNEPSYESIWINQVQLSYSEKGRIYELVCGKGEIVTGRLMNQFQQMVFLGTLLAALAMWKSRELRQCLPFVILLGGIFYHLLFEAKSQYSLVYFILMVPAAACGFCRLFEKIEKR